jgi:hypothetical protein
MDLKILKTNYKQPIQRHIANVVFVVENGTINRGDRTFSSLNLICMNYYGIEPCLSRPQSCTLCPVIRVEMQRQARYVRKRCYNVGPVLLLHREEDN